MDNKIYNKALQDDLARREELDAEQHNKRSAGKELVRSFAKEILQLIKEGLLRDGIVRIHNFGIFRLKMSKARKGFNPQSKQPIVIPARPRVVFSPAKALREKIEKNPKPILPLELEPPKKPAPPIAENPIAIISPPPFNEPVTDFHSTVQEEPHTNESSSQDEIDPDILSGATLASAAMNKTNPNFTAHSAESLESPFVSPASPKLGTDKDYNESTPDELQSRSKQQQETIEGFSDESNSHSDAISKSDDFSTYSADNPALNDDNFDNAFGSELTSDAEPAFSTETISDIASDEQSESLDRSFDHPLTPGAPHTPEIHNTDDTSSDLSPDFISESTASDNFDGYATHSNFDSHIEVDNQPETDIHAQDQTSSGIPDATTEPENSDFNTANIDLSDYSDSSANDDASNYNDNLTTDYQSSDIISPEQHSNVDASTASAPQKSAYQLDESRYEKYANKQTQSIYIISGVTALILCIFLLVLFWWLFPDDQAQPLNSNNIVLSDDFDSVNQATLLEDTPIEPDSPAIKADTTSQVQTGTEEVTETVRDTNTLDTNTAVTTESDSTLVTDSNSTNAVPSTEESQISDATSTEPTTEESSQIADADASSSREAVDESTVTPSTKPFFTETEHQIVLGDNLWKLATNSYINPFLWPHIYRSNHSVITDPNILEINDIITLPILYGPPSELSTEDRYSIAEGYFLLYKHYKKIGYKNAHYALIGVKWFDEKVLKNHMHEIIDTDNNKLNAQRADNRMIEQALQIGSP